MPYLLNPTFALSVQSWFDLYINVPLFKKDFSMNCQQLKANKLMYQILMIMLNDFQYNCQKKLFLVCYWWRENKSLETAPDHNFSPLKSLKHSMSSDLQHINTTVLMEIVGPSHSVVILYMNQTWCWTPAVAVLRSAVVCRPINQLALWDNSGWPPVTFIGALNFLRISLRS